MRDFKQLMVWEKAHGFTLDIYRITASFPKDERFSLVDQIRRSASSIPTNIAEGCGRDTDNDMARFLVIAAGSASEAEYQLILSRDLGYVDVQTFEELNSRVNEIKKMLGSFIRKLKPKC